MDKTTKGSDSFTFKDKSISGAPIFIEKLSRNDKTINTKKVAKIFFDLFCLRGTTFTNKSPSETNKTEIYSCFIIKNVSMISENIKYKKLLNFFFSKNKFKKAIKKINAETIL